MPTAPSTRMEKRSARSNSDATAVEHDGIRVASPPRTRGRPLAPEQPQYPRLPRRRRRRTARGRYPRTLQRADRCQRLRQDDGLRRRGAGARAGGVPARGDDECRCARPATEVGEGRVLIRAAGAARGPARRHASAAVRAPGVGRLGRRVGARSIAQARLGERWLALAGRAPRAPPVRLPPGVAQPARRARPARGTGAHRAAPRAAAALRRDTQPQGPPRTRDRAARCLTAHGLIAQVQERIPSISARCRPVSNDSGPTSESRWSTTTTSRACSS